MISESLSSHEQMFGGEVAIDVSTWSDLNL